MELEFFASCLAGLESALADELKTLGIKRLRPLHGGVAFFGDGSDAYRACLWSRLASRIVLVIERVAAQNAEELYKEVFALKWDEVLIAGATVGVHASGTNDELRNTRFTALKTKDAIVDKLRFASEQSHPSESAVETKTRRVRASIDVRIRGKRATISLDLSGEALNHRWYLSAEDDQDAPYRCSLAAGALACGGWDQAFSREAVMLETSCRDGIMLIEAASVACDLAPGLMRTNWGFEAWSNYDEAEVEALVHAANECFTTRLKELLGEDATAFLSSAKPDHRCVSFLGLSTSSPAIAKARKQIRQAGLRAVISVELGDVTDCASAVHRLQHVGIPQKGKDERPCVVMSCFDADESSMQAQSRAQDAMFLSATRNVKGDPLGIAINAGSLAMDFPREGIQHYELGQGRARATIDVFSCAPQERPYISVVDLDTGSSLDIEVYEANSSQFAARLRKVFKERRKWAAQHNVTCYRIYDSDLPDYAVVIDWYEGAGAARGNRYLHIAEYAPPSSIDSQIAQRRFNDVLTLAPIICGVRPDHVFSKRRVREKGGAQYSRVAGRSYVTTVSENDLTLEVNLAQRLDTGLFLDHRPIRVRIKEMAAGKHFLNLFAYTGVASVYAASGGALSAKTVDLSQVYLDWARRNMKANGFTGAQYEFIKADVMRWITQARRSNEHYDLIFVDPPTFSNSKAMGKKTWDVQRDHVELLIGVTHLLSKEGVAIFSCNLRNFKPDYEKLEKYGVELEDISKETIPEDFARTPHIHSCYIVRKKSR